MMIRKWSRKFWRDWGERVAVTFVEGSVGWFLVELSAGHIDPLDWKALAVGGAAAGVAAVKGLLATWVGREDTASLVQ